MTTSLIISTYNWPEALELCLKSVVQQTQLPTQVIIADDGSRDDTKLIIDTYRAQLSVPLIHVWQEDTGFRLAEIRNKAIAKAIGQYIIQIDGDIILDRNFIYDHIKFAKTNTFIKGRRSNLTQRYSQQLLKTKKIAIKWYQNGVTRKEHGIRLLWLHQLLKVKHETTTNGMMGCNMAFFKSDFMAVNGYNNQLVGWGAEDKELAQRFINLGLKKRKMQFIGIVYHLFHYEKPRNNQSIQLLEVQTVKEQKTIQCKNGVNLFI